MLAISGMDTLELVSRLQCSDVDQATLDAMAMMADRAVLGVPVSPTTGRAIARR